LQLDDFLLPFVGTLNPSSRWIKTQSRHPLGWSCQRLSR